MQNLYQAYLEARRGRRYKPEVLAFGYDIWESLRALREEVLNGKYEIEEYRKFYIHEPKERLIMSIAFKHRVVQWAIYLVVNPLLVNGYIKDSYGCIPGRGPLMAMQRLKGWLEHVSRKNGNWCYLKLDISKYFYRISHEVLEEVLRKKIKDEELMEVLSGIINCKHTPFGLPADKSPGDEMIFETGMPIGNLLSQMFANVYLNELDQFCKRTLAIKHYIRYMDDIIILSDSKTELHEWQNAIKIFLKEKLKLDLNEKTCIRPINQGIEFIGYRLWPNRVYLRKSTTLGMKRGLKGVMAKYRNYEMTLERATETFRSYIGLLKHTDSDALIAALHQRMILTHEEGDFMAATVKVKGLTKHFTLEDYAINQTGALPLSEEALLHAAMLEEFREWLGRPMEVHAWYRTAKYNKSVGGVSTSSHLKGTATDWSTDIKIDEDRFIKYAKKWREICKSHGVVGEAGLYNWGVHFGSSITYSKKFYHWDSRTGKQVNMPFSELK